METNNNEQEIKLNEVVYLWAKDPYYETFFSNTAINLNHITFIKVIGQKPYEKLLLSFVNGNKLIALYDKISVDALNIEKMSEIYTNCPDIISSRQTKKEKILELELQIDQLNNNIERLKALRVLYDTNE